MSTWVNAQKSWRMKKGIYIFGCIEVIETVFKKGIHAKSCYISVCLTETAVVR
jgi:hypothetical protein